MMHFDYWYGAGFGGWIWMLVWWAFIIFGIVYLIKWISGMSGRGNNDGDAVEILKKRYAKGEIGKKEFEEKLKDLQ